MVVVISAIACPIAGRGVVKHVVEVTVFTLFCVLLSLIDMSVAFTGK